MANRFILGLAIFWTLSIAFLCLVQFNNLPNFGVSGMDKYIHFTFHFVFTLLWTSYFFTLQKELLIKSVFKVFYVSVSYGILLEFLQSALTTTRKGDVMDVLANTTGATVAVILLVWYKQSNKNKN